MKNRIKLGLLAMLFIALPIGMGRAAIIANFAGGDGAASVDQFAGIAGDGWLTAWSTTVGGSGTASTPTVLNTTPMNGGGNYLSVPFTVGTSTNDNFVSVNRQFGTAGGVDPSLPYTLRFDYRPEAKNEIANAEFRSRFQIFGSSAAPNGDTSANSTWIIVAAAGASGSAPGGVVVNTWGFLDNPTPGTTSSIGAMNFVSSGIAMDANTVYHFEIAVDPVNRNYTPTVSDGTTSFTSPTPLYFRNQAAAAQSASYLAFGARQQNTSNEGLASYPFSFDSVNIVPEPSSLSLIGFAAFGLSGCIHRRRSKTNKLENAA
jgi:hypothetical protein